MGKRLKVQRRGRGGSVFRAAKLTKIAPAKYPGISKEDLNGTIKEMVHEGGRGAPLAYVEFQQGKGFYSAAVEGTYVNQEISVGPSAPARLGNVLQVGSVPEGTMVCNIELRAGDGGKVARASGSFGTVIAHTDTRTSIRLPSRRMIHVPNEARATIGIISGGGRKEKPFMKAGAKLDAKRAKGHKYPIAHGVKMPAAMHPHGGGRHRRPGKSTTVSRHAPPGAKVGLIAARTSGRGGKRQRA
ncbi:50S ribosomal protein L2 [Candidatus Bathyarchaeota archaeon RBG_13_60_20]|nr:MAG: 50S ribosomal protein L2 [Candidatus Bathyarchaeota archaeon RBG_13_60_20]